MKKSILTLLIATSTIVANASDLWDSCVSSDGRVQLENGYLASEFGNYELGKQVKKVLIKTRVETCKLENAKTEVLSMDEETSYEVYEIKIDSKATHLDFLCTRGGSGIPANDSCDESTAKLVETYKVK